MAEINTVIAEASQDLQTIEDFVNLPAGSEVYPRLLPTTNVGTLAGAREAIFEAGGLPATPFATKALMTASALVDGKYAQVTDDTVNNGLYVKTAGAWVKSAYDPTRQAVNFINEQHSTAFALAAGVENFTIDTSTKKLVIIGAGVRIFKGSESYTTTNASLDLPSSDGTYRVEYSKANSAYSLVASSSALTTNSAFVARLVKIGGEYTLYGIDRYTVDGKIYGGKVEPEMHGKVYTVDAAAFNVNKTLGLLEVGNVRIYHNNESFLGVAGNVTLPTINGIYRIEYNRKLQNYQIVPTSAAINKSAIIIGSILRFDGDYKVFGIDVYSINGVPASGGGTNTASGLVRGALLTPTASDINIDSVNHLITVKANTTRLVYGGKSILLPAQSMSYAGLGSWGWMRIIYDLATAKLSIESVTAVNNTDKILVSYFYVLKLLLLDVPEYTLDGLPIKKPYGIRRIDTIVTPTNVSKNWRPDVELESIKPVYDATINNLSALYGLYDALMTASPDYITSKVLGTDIDGNEVRQYTFSAPQVYPHYTDKSRTTRPKMILCSSVHGEFAGVYNLYNSLKIICEQWETDESLEAIRWGVDLVVVPVVTPYVFINAGRKNKNGVDIARNFKGGWVLGTDPSANTYGGTAPLSEKESQLLDGVMQEHSDAIGFLSHHSLVAPMPAVGSGDFMPEGTFLWIPAATYFTQNMGKALTTQVTISAKKRYPYIKTGTSTYIGYSDLNVPAGSEGRHAAQIYGIQGSTFETNQWVVWEDGTPLMSAATTTLGAECLINWLLLNLRHAPEFYNNLKY